MLPSAGHDKRALARSPAGPTLALVADGTDAAGPGLEGVEAVREGPSRATRRRSRWQLRHAGRGHTRTHHPTRIAHAHPRKVSCGARVSQHGIGRNLMDIRREDGTGRKWRASFHAIEEGLRIGRDATAIPIKQRGTETPTQETRPTPSTHNTTRA